MGDTKDKINIIPGNFARAKPLRNAKQLDAMKFDEIIDCGIEDFIAYLERQNIGGAMSLRNVLAITFNELSEARKEIVKKVRRGTLKKDDPEVDKTLSGIYEVMGRIEAKYPYVQKRIQKIVENDPNHRKLLGL